MHKKTYFFLSLLLFIFFLQTFTAMLKENDTWDEALHLTSGYSYWKTGQFRLNTLDHPPLAELLAAFPLLFLSLDFPREHPSLWLKKRYNLADEFVYRNKQPAKTILFWGRLPIAGLSVVLGFFIFWWAYLLWGTKGGLLSLLVFAFSSEMLAHSHYVTTDLAVTCFSFLTVLSFWYYLKKPNKKIIIITGLCLGLALASKFTAVLLLPILVILIVFYRRQKLPVADFFILTFSAVFFLAACYGFGDFKYYFSGLGRILPGGDITQGRSAFLIGKYSLTGWWYYFPVAFLIKTPLPLLILIGIKLFKYVGTRQALSLPSLKSEFFLLVPILIFFLTACLSKVDIGIRHILPIYPFLFVWVGSITKGVEGSRVQGFKRRTKFMILFFLLGWYLWGTLKIHPHYLAYFNEAVGGPKNGYKYLVDSNLDWGQDLINLKKYLDKQEIEEVYLSYFGFADPNYYGLNYRGIGFYSPLERIGKAEKLPFLKKQIFVISATNLQGVYFQDHSVFQWLKRYPLVAQIGYSLFVYDITDQIEAHQQLENLFRRSGQIEYAEQENKYWRNLGKYGKNFN